MLSVLSSSSESITIEVSLGVCSMHAHLSCPRYAMEYFFICHFQFHFNSEIKIPKRPQAISCCWCHCVYNKFSFFLIACGSAAVIIIVSGSGSSSGSCGSGVVVIYCENKIKLTQRKLGGYL